MDNELFLKKLSELTEWHRPQTGPNGHPSVSKGRERKQVEKPEPVTEAELDAMTDTEVQEYYDRLVAWRESLPNDSVPPEIIRLKCNPHDCEDCGQTLNEHRKIECKKYDSAGGHWRTRCANCGNYQHPHTKEFSVSQGASHQFFLNFYRPKLGKYKSKYQPHVNRKVDVDVSKLKTQILNYTVTETETDIIRSLDSNSKAV